jgi:hypothetical protein
MAAIAHSLLGVAAQLGFLIGDPASAAMQPAQDRLCDRPTSLCMVDPQRLQGLGKRSEPGRAEHNPVGLEDLRQRLLASSLRLASLNRAAPQNLQAWLSFNSFRYAIATNNYFRVRHAKENCTEQVAAWNTALNEAKRANINSHLRDIPPDCQLR